MRLRKLQVPVSAIISFVIITGFGLTALYSYLSFQKLFRADVEAVSELTSQNIYVNMNNLMDRPLNVSLAMANDTFLREFVQKDEVNKLQQDSVETIQDYLSSYQKKYEFASVFFISAKTGAYYHFENGVDRIMEPTNPENVWYYDFLKDPRECALNVDNDEAKHNVITIFVNCKLYDENNTILGVVGVGMETPYIQHFLSENEDKYGIHAYLIDKSGKVQLSSTLTGFAEFNLFSLDTFKPMQEAILENTSSAEQKWYHSKEADGYIVSKYVPSLNWYLVVEKSIVDFRRQMTNQIMIGFIFLLLVVAIVIYIVSAVHKNNKQDLVFLAQMDQLTGIRNRTSYEQEMEIYKNSLEGYSSFGIGIFDLNNLKKINDQYGHQAGDEYIQTFSDLLCRSFRISPVFRIGGDEFAVILMNVSEDEMLESAKELQQQLHAEQIGEIPLRAAFGYAYYNGSNLSTVEAIFKAADDNMYLDKEPSKRSSS